MKHDILKRLGAMLLVAAGLGVGTIPNGRGASVGVAGYTNAFTTQPAAADWAGVGIAGSSLDITNAAGLDAAVAALAAAAITNQVVADATVPPAASSSASWSSSGGYLQTRPTLVKFSALLARLVNATGTDASTALINYDFAAVAPVTEEVPGHRVYYSLTGAANSWSNVPALSSPAAGRVNAALHLSPVWTNGATLYLLWADDNAAWSPDAANQLDNFSVSVPMPAAILAFAPSNAVVCPGAAVHFTVSATGHPPLCYQWRQLSAGVANDIPNATNADYVIASAGASAAGGYVVVVTNNAGAVTSAVATLTVAAQPIVVASPPQDQFVPVGTAAVFTIGLADGAALPVACQWFFNHSSNNFSGLAVMGATNAQLTITNAAGASVGFYYAVLSNCANSVTSAVVALAVNYGALSITAQPQGATQYVGSAWTMTVGVSGTVGRLQWFKGAQALSGATNASLTLTNLQLTDTGLYHAEVTNGTPSFAASANAVLLVLLSPYALVPLTNTWKYNQTGTDLGTAWPAANYNDASWPAGLGVLAKDDNAAIVPLIKTTLSLTNASGAANITYYFRTTFNLTNDPASITITTSNLIDDGCVVYLNGTEAYRINMPAGPVSYSTLTPGLLTEGVFIVTNLPVSLLVPGTNVLAVEVHQQSLSSSDIVFGWSALVNSLPPSPIQITSQPQSVAVDELRPASFAVGFSGGPAQVQWFKQGVNGPEALPAATAETLTLPHPRSGVDEGMYFAVLSNMFSLLSSAPATLTITQAAPTLVSGPASQNACLGAEAVFQVVAYGSQFSLFQWRWNDTDIAGATNASYRIPSVGISDAGSYVVVVSNALGVAVSIPAALSVTPQSPVITLPPATTATSTGGVLQLTAAATGCLPLSYQWQFNDTNLPGATAVALTLTGVQPAQAGNYRIVVSNSFGVVTSAEARVWLPTIGEALNCTNVVWTNGATRSYSRGWSLGAYSYTANLTAGSAQSRWAAEGAVTHDGVAALQPGSLSGSQASTLTANVTGPGRLSFWWKIETNDVGAALLFLIDGGFPSFFTDGTNWAQAVFYLPAGAHLLEWLFTVNGTLSQPVAWLAEVTYATNGLEPEVLTAPQSLAVPAGSNAIFTVTADGYPPFRYQWQFQGVDVPNADQTIFTVANARSSDAGAYTVVVANDFGEVTSSVARLTVIDQAISFRPSRLRILAVPGGDAWFRAGAVGSEPIGYQWRREGVDIIGATNDTLVLHEVGTNQVGRYSVVASNSCGAVASPEMELILGRISQVIHISADGLSGKYLASALVSEPYRYPNFRRLTSEGAFTYNARCDYDISYTVPNHLSMLTGRSVLQPAGQPNTVQHGYTADGTPSTNTTVHNSGNPNVAYKSSVFDVAHDRGLRTGFLVGKSTLAVCAQSYDANNGAPDLIPPDDNGRGKIDLVFVADSYTAGVIDAFLPSLTNGALCQYAFLHFTDMDNMGHSTGWGSAGWFGALEALDAQLGRLLDAIDTNSNPTIALETAIILTADHGGYGLTHVDPTLEYDYTIPLFVRSPGFQPGADLYGYFANRTDPGTSRVDYNGIWQPLRNGDTGNLALALLGLPTIPGSTLVPLFPTNTPSLSLVARGQKPVVAWSAAAAGFVLEASGSLASAAAWTPVTTGIVTNANGFSYELISTTESQFFRLRR